MNRKAWGVCSGCNKYAEAPKGFSESRHFLECGDCGHLMYLDYHNPEMAAYKKCENPARFISQDRS